MIKWNVIESHTDSSWPPHDGRSIYFSYVSNNVVLTVYSNKVGLQRPPGAKQQARFGTLSKIVGLWYSERTAFLILKIPLWNGRKYKNS